MPTPTYAATINLYRLQSEQRIRRQEISTLVFPHDFLNYILLIVYLYFPRRLSLASRILFFVAIVALSVLSLMESRTLGLAYGVLAGISSSWCIALSANLIFLYQPARDFKRKLAYDTTYIDESTKGTHAHEQRWQTMPDHLPEKLFWILDLIGSLRALHWSYGQSPESTVEANRLKGSRKAPKVPLFGWNLGKLVLVILCIDCLKEIIAMDPYFWGCLDHEPPDYVKSLSATATFVQTYRMLVALGVMYSSIQFLCTVEVLLFVNLLGPSIAGSWSHGWAHRPLLGTLNSICNRGLQGFWGGWWHQLFRLTFVAPANAMIDKLSIERESLVARALVLVISFSFSGIIHACGSYTMWGESKPMYSFTFFAIQPAGIMIQIMGREILRWLGILNRTPRPIRMVTNFLYTALWLLQTFPLLADDFARGGLWLLEPFPFSVLQSLGFGNEARSHDLWLGYGLQLHIGRRWWQVGLAA